MTGHPKLVVGRYELYDEIASGGIATVHFGRYRGPAGFQRTVAVKRLHAQYAKDSHFVTMFLDEARLVTRISHPNVVPVLDIVSDGQELLLVMEYVRGEALSRLLRVRAANKMHGLPPPVAAAIMGEALLGLHAAHEATTEGGEPLQLVHRDVSPQNIMVGVDGRARVLDFGMAHATERAQVSRDGELKGKTSYFAPEQIRHDSVSRQSDIFSASIVLWETLVGRQLFSGDNPMAICAKILRCDVPPPSSRVAGIPPTLDAVVLKGLAADPARRHQSAEQMAAELHRAVAPASPVDVGGLVRGLVKEALRQRDQTVKEIESLTSIDREQLVELSSDAARRVEEGSGGALGRDQTSRLLQLGRKPMALGALAICAALVLLALLFWPSAAERSAAGDVSDPAGVSPVSKTGPVPALVQDAGTRPDRGQRVAVGGDPDAATRIRVSSWIDAGAKSPRVKPRPDGRGKRGGKWRGQRRTKQGASCDPPYTVDADGVRIPKPECL